jgi:hypothetical protein
MDIYWNTQKGDVRHPPSEKQLTITGFDLFRIMANGKIAELWQQFNVGNWI